MISIQIPCREYKKMQKHWLLIDALWGGTITMREGGELWLPKNTKEDEGDYKERLNRTFLTNYFKYSISGLIGKVFKKEPSFDNISSLLEEWIQNIDLSGSNISVFAQKVFMEAMKYGMSHILVDMPNTENVATLYEEKKQGIRPYLQHISIKDLIGWRWQVVNGKPVLTEIRIKETYTETCEEGYEDLIKEQIKRFYINESGICAWEVWRTKDKNATMDLYDEGLTSLGYIPFFTFYTNKEDYLFAKPPLEDLAYLNLRHWQSSSDQNNILHTVRVPVLFAKGVDSQSLTDLTIGANRLIAFPEKEADLRYVEHNGAGISAGRQDLLDLEDAMRLMAMSVIKQANQVTATEKAIDTKDSNSLLQDWVLVFQDTLNTCFWAMADYAKTSRETIGSIVLNTEFEVFRDASDLQTLQQARAMNEISKQTYLKELQRRDVLSSDVNIDDEISMTEIDVDLMSGFEEPQEEVEEVEND